MRKATPTRFRSEFGFESPNFSVDENGNIVANSITTEETATGGTEPIVDFTVVDNTNFFAITEVAGTTPSIEMEKGRTYIFELSMTADNRFYVYVKGVGGEANTLYENIRHSDGSTGTDAQGKADGYLYVIVQNDTPDLLYGNLPETILGDITIIDPSGVFSKVSISSTVIGNENGTSALNVQGGAYIGENLLVGKDVTSLAPTIPRLSSYTNLEVNAENRIVFQISDNYIGEVNSDGLSFSLNNSTITQSTIESTNIGEESPATGNFTQGSVSSTPVGSTDIANKRYVDGVASALSIALGT